MTATALAEACNTAWQAGLELGFEQRRGATQLSHRKRYGPLAVQRPFYPEGEICHVYLLHPPGGVVGGDQLHIDIELGENSQAMVTTPGAAKFYRSEQFFAHQEVSIRLAPGAELEWLPQENILFRGARLRQTTHIELAEGARFIGCETICLGRPANGELFDRGEARFHTRLSREGTPLQIETMRIGAELGRTGAASLRSYPVSAITYATPINQAQLESLRASLATSEAGDYFALTLVGDLLIARFLGLSTLRAQRRFTALWKQLRPMLMHRPASIPRIWKT